MGQTACCEGPAAPLVLPSLAGGAGSVGSRRGAPLPEWDPGDDSEDDPDAPPKSDKTWSAAGQAARSPVLSGRQSVTSNSAPSESRALSPRASQSSEKTLELGEKGPSGAVGTRSPRSPLGPSPSFGVGDKISLLRNAASGHDIDLGLLNGGMPGLNGVNRAVKDSSPKQIFNRSFIKDSEKSSLFASRAGTQDLHRERVVRSETADISHAASTASSSWLQPKGAISAAMNYLGFRKGQKGSSSGSKLGSDARVEEFTSELLEFAFSIVLATSNDCAGFVRNVGQEDRKALLQLSESARSNGLMGNSSLRLQTPVPMDQMIKAFMASKPQMLSPVQSADQRRDGSTAGPRRELLDMRSSSSTLTGLETRKVYARGGLGSTSSIWSRRQVTFDELHASEHREDGDRPGVRSSQLTLNRSLSNFSATSFDDFNRRQPHGRGGAVHLPSFLEFVSNMSQGLAGQGLGGVREDDELIDPNTNVVMDVDLTPELPAGGKFNFSQSQELQSEAGMSYHSLDDAMLAEERRNPVVQAEVMNLGGGVKIAFKSRCLRTQNEWQSHMLHAQRALLDTISTQLREKEQHLKASDEVKEEEKEILRGFRKIISREVGEDDAESHHVSVVIVEQDDELRKATEELCNILEYPVKSYRVLQSAVKDLHGVAQGLQPIPATPRANARSSNGRNSLGSGTVEPPGRVNLLDGRPGSDGEFRSWRADTLLTGRSGKENKGKGPKKVPGQKTVQVVLLGRVYLDKGIPDEWRQEGFFVVLTSHSDEFEAVGDTLVAKDEAKIRERLRSRGFCDYLLHPLSVGSLRSVVGQALRQSFGDEYLLLQAVGRGTSGVVHKAKRVRDGVCFALKEINTKRLSKNAKRDVEREKSLLQELHWPTVVFLVDTWEAPAERLRYILMPLLEGGNLLTRAEQALKGGVKINAVQVVEWYAQTLHGLSYLHWRGIVHCDMKPGNLLLGSDCRLLQIGDLGSAMLLPGNGPHPSRRNFVKCQACTPVYSSPEVLSNERYHVASDVWSAGMTFFEVLTAQTMFPADAPQAELTELASNFDSRHSDSFRLIREGMVEGAAKQPPATDLPDLLASDPMRRPMCCELASRPTTARRLKEVLVNTGSVRSETVRQHFEDCTKIRSRSEAAAPLDPPPPEPDASPASTAAGRRRAR